MVDLRKTLAIIEQLYISEALGRCKGNRAQASKLLKIHRTTLVEKMRRYGYKLNPRNGAKYK